MGKHHNRIITFSANIQVSKRKTIDDLVCRTVAYIFLSSMLSYK